MKPTGASSKRPLSGLAGGVRLLMPCRCRQRWMALRDSFAFTQRCMASTMLVLAQAGIVERQPEPAQFAGELLLEGSKAGIPAAAGASGPRWGGDRKRVV